MRWLAMLLAGTALGPERTSVIPLVWRKINNGQPWRGAGWSVGLYDAGHVERIVAEEELASEIQQTNCTIFASQECRKVVNRISSKMGLDLFDWTGQD